MEYSSGRGGVVPDPLVTIYITRRTHGVFLRSRGSGSRPIGNDIYNEKNAWSIPQVEGEWFPTHWVASNLREIRAMLLEIAEEEKELGPVMVDVLHRCEREGGGGGGGGGGEGEGGGGFP